MITRSPWTLAVLASLLVAVIATFAWSSWSSPDTESAASVGSPAKPTSAASASSAPTTSAGTPSSTVPPAASSTTPAPEEPSRVPAPELARVDVVTTFAGWNATSGAVEVGGYATVVEPVGACTLRLTRGDQVVTRKQTASADATTVACGGFSVPRSALTAGEWRAVLSYASPRSAGAATPVMVKVP